MARYPAHNNLTEEELLVAYKNSNDNQWLGFLLQRYTLLLFGVAMKYLKDKDKAGDAVQHIFLKVLTHFPKEDIHNFKGWLYIMMRNHCLQELKVKKEVAADTFIVNSAEVEEDLELKDYTLAQLENAVAGLSPEQKVCISLFYLEDKSYSQITEQTGYNFTQVKSYIQNGKRNLKGILLKRLAERPDE